MRDNFSQHSQPSFLPSRAWRRITLRPHHNRLHRRTPDPLCKPRQRPTHPPKQSRPEPRCHSFSRVRFSATPRTVEMKSTLRPPLQSLSETMWLSPVELLCKGKSTSSRAKAPTVKC